MTVNFLFFSVRRVQQRMAGVVASTAWILAVTMGLGALLLRRQGQADRPLDHPAA
ncbi:MAG: hypothetical protein RDU83_01040 [bacterium]|nr:hypothetical protein [bacterium]